MIVVIILTSTSDYKKGLEEDNGKAAEKEML